MVVVAVEQENGNVAALPVERRVAEGLVAKFGVERGNAVDMSGVIGLPVHYEESAVGYVNWLEVLAAEDCDSAQRETSSVKEPRLIPVSRD
jgi:hypothetical protein